MNAAQAALRMAQAGRLVAGETLPGGLGAEDRSALGWALKDHCYAAWSSEPQRAVRAAEVLGRLRDSADGEPEMVALAAWTQGVAHLIQGEMDAATVALDAAAATFAALHEPGHAARTQVPKIMALAMLGRHDDAAACAEAAQRALLADGDLHAASRVSLNLGNLQLRADRYRAAAAHFREAAALFARVGDPEHSVMAENGLADALTALGELDDAARSYDRARTLAATHGFPVLEALVEESVALLDLVRGHYREALAGLEGARRRYAALEMPQHLAIAEKQLADAYLELRLLPEALAGYDVALDRFAALDMQVDRAWTLVQRGRALALAGQRGAAAVALGQAELAIAGHNTRNPAGNPADADAGPALALAREAAAAFQRAGLVERQLRAEVVQAQALLQRGEVARARALFDATLTQARQRQLLPVQLRCLTGRAMAALAAADRPAARQDLEAAAELFEDQRRTLPGDEVRSAFQSDHLLPFQQLLRLALLALADGDGDAAEVLAQLDRFRARTLADRLGAADHGPGEGDAQRAETQDLRAHLAWLYRRLDRLHSLHHGAGAAGAASALGAELRATECELLERVRRMRLAAGAAAPAQARAELDIATLQRALEPGDALVEYGVQDGELFACVVTRAQVQVQRRLADWQQVSDAVRAVRFQVETLRHGSAPVQQHLPVLEQRVQAHLQRLHALVWQPLAPLLGERRRVLVVPQAQLGSVPFAALHDGRRCLAEHLQVAFAPSARFALRALMRKPQAAARVLALGESERLPHAAREAISVAALLPKGQAFVGAEATVANLRVQGANADVIHLACHAEFRADNPVFSALHLHDGALTAEAIESLNLPGTLVVLSACDTALSETGGGDEMFGLPRAFLVAGASRVLAALWPVDDATTAELMVDFYAGLRRGQAPGAALRLAQLAARQRRAHPFYWAPFALVGRW